MKRKEFNSLRKEALALGLNVTRQDTDTFHVELYKGGALQNLRVVSINGDYKTELNKIKRMA